MLKRIVENVVAQATALKNKHTDEKNALVNYACIFCQSNKEYLEFLDLAGGLGEKIEDTNTGPLFRIFPVETVSGNLRLLKIRKPDQTRLERGDADFTVNNYISFKEKYLSSPGFRLIERDDYEMIELTDDEFKVRAYFSNPPLDEQLGLNN